MEEGEAHSSDSQDQHEHGDQACPTLPELIPEPAQTKVRDYLPV